MSAYAGRFAPLIALLAAQGTDGIDLSFDEIEAIIGEGLTPRERTNSDLWTSRQYAHVRRLEARGWRAHLDRSQYVVRFSRRST